MRFYNLNWWVTPVENRLDCFELIKRRILEWSWLVAPVQKFNFILFFFLILLHAIFLEWWSHILNITFSVALQQPFLIPRAILIDSWLRLHLCLLTVSPQNLPGTLGEFSTFLGTNLSEKSLQGIADHCCFKSMSKNCMSNYSLVPKEFMDQSKSQFLRKGMSLTQTNWYCYPRPWWIQLLHGQKLILT